MNNINLTAKTVYLPNEIMKHLLIILIVSLASLNVSKAKPLINQLKTGDTLTIQMISHGGLGYKTDRILVVKSELLGYTAIYGERMKSLSKTQISAIRKFERAKIRKTCKFCIMTNYYTLTLGDRTREKIDRCYSWKGYSRLLEQLGFSES